VIADNIIENNIAIPPMDGGSHGGGIYSGYAGTTILRNIIRGNISGPSSYNVASGGGISCYMSNSYIYGNIIKENIASLTGGGIDCGFSSPTIENNLIIGNQCGYSPANSHGGAIDCGVSFVIIRNNTIYGNTATGAGGAVFFSGNDSLLITITNNICWNNTAPADPELHIYGGDPTITYNDIQGGWPGVGNINVEPGFRNPGNGNFHLSSTDCGNSFNSPCIDAGDPNLSDDLLNCLWGLGALRSDMGAYGGGDSLITGILDFPSFLPEGFTILQNYPNPFNAATTVRYSLPNKSEISLSIYNLLGQRVETLFDGVQDPGEHALTWDASRLPSGVYFARLETAGRTENIKMVLLK